MTSRAQIIATIGPASDKPEVLRTMIENQMDMARFNFEWFDPEVTGSHIDRVRAAARECGRQVGIIADLPGARVQLEEGHTYDASFSSDLSSRDEAMLRFCAAKQVEYVALSFVGKSEDVLLYRNAIQDCGGTQKIIAKIERKVALDTLDSIIAAADAVMVARGDLGKEVPLEEIPFVQKAIIAKARAAGKPVITATQMLLSMTEHPEPTRAEVTDVEEAVMEGSDAVMLSEETSTGHFPAEAVAMMERIVVEAEKHRPEFTFHSL